MDGEVSIDATPNLFEMVMATCREISFCTVNTSPAVHTAPSSHNPPPAITAAATLAIAAIEVVLERCHRAAQLAHDTVGVPSCAGRAVDPGAGSVDTGGGASFIRILSTGAMNR